MRRSWVLSGLEYFPDYTSDLIGIEVKSSPRTNSGSRFWLPRKKQKLIFYTIHSLSNRFANGHELSKREGWAKRNAYKKKLNDGWVNFETFKKGHQTIVSYSSSYQISVTSSVTSFNWWPMSRFRTFLVSQPAEVKFWPWPTGKIFWNAFFL